MVIHAGQHCGAGGGGSGVYKIDTIKLVIAGNSIGVDLRGASASARERAARGDAASRAPPHHNEPCRPRRWLTRATLPPPPFGRRRAPDAQAAASDDAHVASGRLHAERSAQGDGEGVPVVVRAQHRRALARRVLHPRRDGPGLRVGAPRVPGRQRPRAERGRDLVRRQARRPQTWPDRPRAHTHHARARARSPSPRVARAASRASSPSSTRSSRRTSASGTSASPSRTSSSSCIRDRSRA